ncbi:hypothetical protein HRR83_005988 [Exophiala dermatitidis]|uniref:TATA-binding protein interacting (TIP20) domain-containing protein n=2 Tax=Exophiala dermatitidis TaxID=5970 RepID=H6BN99_EXODN|nr:uncharacterized protein HMPREF1120_01365 [Exophiala dermatitidis NIH/UT8656]KAJ4512037.1 hypothetical protein HRR75_004937 [Exophiala dermatitidis]EHY53167.1 hypothetical protein HMPREF1120_01365 [Exophiala dermatitidis NIH/UT8656]KAJ4514920.1 hypothetical protein HRR74_005385 [Exophiala dermatitidis]KAJ4517411.1 hypothetical protein HRR73_004463 [Exophiala dermatitidis]KAJ4548838.1 hypothetical protein HRR76_001417 [Exophiala dermatitidis]
MAKDRSAAQQGISSLLSKINDPDPDIRYMQLSDLMNILLAPASDYLRNDPHTTARIVDALLKSLADQHGEVQNQALKCVGPLAARTPGDIIAPLIDKLTDLTNTDIDISVPTTALRTLIAALPQPQHAGGATQEVREAYSAVSRVLIPRLVGHVVLPSSKPSPQLPTGLLDKQKEKGYSSDAVDVMIEVVRCYGSLLQEQELVALARSVMNIIESPQAGGVVKKRALAGVGALIPHFSDAQISSFVTAITQSFQNPQLTTEHRKFLVATVGTLARSSPGKFGPFVDTVVPFVFQVLSSDGPSSTMSVSDEDGEVDPEVEELHETALVALEALVGSCPTEMAPHLPEAVDAALRYVKYDPNVAESDDFEMEGAQDTTSEDGITEESPDDDEDDEYAELDNEDAFSDVDDLSWKVRRFAAKVLYTIVMGVAAADRAILFEKIAPVLISRLFNEREDSVRLEIIAALTALIRKTGSGLTQPLTRVESADDNPAAPTNTRKRRRQDSEADRQDPDLRGLVATRSSPPIIPASPPSGSQAELINLVPNIVQALCKLWKKASMALKQASVVMLKTLTLARNGILSDHLQQLEDPIADALKPSTASTSGGTGSGTSATVASLQIETLTLISAIAETNGTTVLIPFVIALIPPVIAIARDTNYKVTSEALATIEQFIKALTPPRLPTAHQDHAIHIGKLWDVIMERVTDNNADLEVRHRAIQVFGVLIARTSNTQLLSSSTRMKSLGILHDRLKNETTRLASARAIGLIAEAAGVHDNIGSAWIQDVTLEMAHQLRKADRGLRGACLESLQYLALNPVTASQLETTTILELQSWLMPLISISDLHLLTPALVILSKIIPTNPEALVNAELVHALHEITHTRLEGPPLRAYLLVVKVIGESGVGAPLMKGLLAVGVKGETMVLGRAIGTLLVYGGDNLGVTITDFLNELQASQDVRAVCLALTVLGEVGFRMGAKSPVKIDTFTKCLSAESDKVRLAAAVALGSASSNNVSECLPVILQSLNQSPAQDYLYLHSLKEILEHHSQSSYGEVAPYASELWQKLFVVSQAEDNSAVGAECIGRLATIDPDTYVPELAKSLENPNPSIRGTVISAFRFTLGEASNAYNTILVKMMTPMLQTMLNDPDIGNRRLAVTTLNAAIHNKPELVIPDISQLLPPVLEDSRIKPELVKTIKIGPFTHNEDAGLDVRKAAYATMYALLDCPSAIPHLPISKIFDRILDGIADDADIRTLCLLMLGRLAVIDPDETRRRLSSLAEKFRVVLGAKVKETAVKQEIEKVNEANAAVIRTTVELDRKFPATSTDANGEMVAWRSYVEYVKKEFATVARNAMAESG